MADQERTETHPLPVAAIAVIALVLIAGVIIWVAPFSNHSRRANSQPAAAESPATPEPTAQSADATGAAAPPPSSGPSQALQAANADPSSAVAPLVPVVTAGEIAANPALFYGRPVSVYAEVEDVIDTRSFTIDEDRIGASPDVLVLLPDPAAGAAPVAGGYVTVVGEVHPFIESRLTSEFTWFRPSPAVVVRLRARPVLIASSARTATGVSLTRQTAAEPVLVTNPGRITDVPGRFYGQRVLVPDASIDTLRSPLAFTLDDPAFLADHDLLVMLPPKSEARGAVREGQAVTVRGTVRRYVAQQFERDYDWFEAGDFGDLTAWSNRPVLVADLLRPEGGPEVVLLELDWSSPSRLDGKDWWVRQAWEPLPRVRTDSPPRPDEPARGEPIGESMAWPITQIETLLEATDRRSFDGRAVAIERTQVQEVIGDAILLVGPAADRGMAVRLASTSGFSPGTTIALEGTVRGVPQSLDGWHLADKERAALATRQIFIEGLKVVRTAAAER